MLKFGFLRFSNGFGIQSRYSFLPCFCPTRNLRGLRRWSVTDARYRIDFSERFNNSAIFSVLTPKRYNSRSKSSS